ncbi:hypothetical protein B0A55_00525 [Friedmanniomyces simplex]|uniref:Borealin N-terminal domain-containing protein n=1 Tax=Friedmanniomyces simplex TaxID=329884 RepID=A0A4U0Y342_9PEZI|nr:hypothetical protein B0A55_00525 [Friedmanniomyces simplex]
MIPTKTEDLTHTPPERSPAKRTVAAGITQAQKQALIDNLQLEITERARKLRAQYALQAQGLRTRLEMRVNRIPQALRQRKMGDLLEEHTEKARAKAEPDLAPPVPVNDTAVEQQRVAAVVKSPERERKSLKRQSDQISTQNNNHDDKENAPAPAPIESTLDLPNPKKRVNTATTTANTKATRTVSRKGPAPSTVLSPKSHNSRTLPRSPFKPALSPEKTAMLERLASPIKSSIQHLAPPAKGGTQAPSRQTKRPGTAMEAETERDATEGRSSEASTTSAGTTIVTKPATKVGRPAGAKKATAATAAKTTAVGRKPAAAKKENVPPVPVGGGRTLRKRG